MSNDNNSSKSNASVTLMKLLEKMEMDKLNPYQVDKYVDVAIFFVILAVIVCYFQIGSTHHNSSDYHGEIIPSRALSYIKNGQLIALVDGAYPVAMPSEDSYVDVDDKKVFPMMLILVPQFESNSNTVKDFNLYPLNIVDDSILPRRGRTLALHILFGFTSDHAENKLLYDEKVSDSAAEDYKRKAFYYLVVKNGYGTMQRGYMNKDNADDNLRYYRDVDHVIDELITIYHIIN